MEVLPRSKSRARSLASRPLLLLLPTLVFFATIEGVMRHTEREDWPWGITRDDPVLGWRLNPGWSGRYHGVTVVVSDAGLRDRRTASELEQLSGATVFLGDSVVMGFGLPDESTIARHLEQLAGRPVVNAGVIGYGTLQEAALLPTLPVPAPEVIVGFCLNDIASSEQYRVRTAPRSWAARLSEDLRERSALFHWMRKRARGILRQHGLVDEVEPRDFSLSELETRIAKDRDGALSETREAFGKLAARHALVVLFPYREQMVEGAPRPQDLVRSEAEKAHLPVLDLLEPFRARGGDDLFIDNCHFSARGADVVAASIASWLLQSSPPTESAEKR